MESELGSRAILVTELDLKVLKSLLDIRRSASPHDQQHIEMLARELEHAHVVKSTDIPPDVITMNSRVRIQDLDSGEEKVYSLVFPAAADIGKGRLSILAPIGTALLGYRQGDVIEWPVPRGVRRVRVLEVLYQPEAAGDASA